MRSCVAILRLYGRVSVACLFILMSHGCSSRSPDQVATLLDVNGGGTSEAGRKMDSPTTTIISGRLLSPQKQLIVPVYNRDGKSVDDPKAAVMVLDGPNGIKYPPTPANALRLAGRKEAIIPSFCVCVAGQELIVTSHDNHVHNYHIQGVGYTEPSPASLPIENKQFTRVFNKSVKLLNLSCSSHPAEKATVAIAPYDLYSLPDRKGTYRIEARFPPGEYKLRAVSPEFGVVEKTISIKQEDRAVEVDFQFEE